MKIRNILAASAVLALAASPAFATGPINSTNYLYAADFGTGKLQRYTAVLNTVGGHPQEVLTALNTTTVNNHTNPFSIIAPSGDVIKEGISGTSNTIITVVKTATDNQLARFQMNGTFIGFINNGTASFKGVGSFVITPDAKFAYVADSTASKVYKVDLATGGVVATSATIGTVHDVALLPDGTVIAEKLGGGITHMTANLTSPTTIISIGTVAQAEPVSGPGNLQGHNQYGYAVDSSGNIWTVSDDRSGGPGNSPNTSGTLYEFSSTGQYINSWTPGTGSGLAVGTFGLSFGDDGNLYLSDIGNVVLPSSPGTDQIDEFNVYTDQFSTYIQGSNNATQNTSTGLAEPKYANWQSTFAPAPDPGYTVPEPSGVATSIAFVGIVGLLVAGAKRKASRSL